MRTGQARKRDANETAIVRALEGIGVTVRRISAPGLPDLLTHSRGVWLQIEVKRHPPRPRRFLSDRHGQSLTPAQSMLYHEAPFPVVTTVAEALALFGVRS